MSVFSASVAAAQPAGVLKVRNFPYDRDMQSVAAEGGDLWIGTSGGVLRYDPLTDEFERFVRTPGGLPDNQITSIAASADGVVWAGTNLGLGRFDPLTRTWAGLTTANSPLTRDAITALAVDGQRGRTWVGTFSGLVRIEGEQWTEFDPNTSDLSDPFVTSLEVDPDSGGVWIGMFSAGVDFLVDDQFSNFQWFNTGSPPGVCFDEQFLDPNQLGLISSVVEVQGRDPLTGDVWFRNVDDGPCDLNSMTRVSSGEWSTFTTHNSPLQFGFVDDVVVDGNGDTWFCGLNGIERRTAGGAWAHFPIAATAGAAAGGRLWFLTPGGLVEHDGAAFQPPRFNPGLPSNVAWATAVSPHDEDKDEVWFGTGSGAARFDDGEWTVFDPNNSGLAQGDVRAIQFDAQGRVWLGTTVAGVSVYDGATWQTYNTGNSGIHGDRVETMAIDRDGRMWFAAGLFGGVSSFDGATWAMYPALGTVRDIAAAPNGDVWFASTAGARRMRNGVVTTFTTAHGLPSNVLSAVDIAADGAVWVGTSVSGAARFNGATFQAFRTQDGLPSNRITAVEALPGGDVWVSTLDNGLARYRRGEWVRFGFDQGLLSNRVRSLDFGGQSLWVGTEFGACALDLRPWPAILPARASLPQPRP